MDHVATMTESISVKDADKQQESNTKYTKLCVGTNVYPQDIEVIRKREYPALKDTIYLDHAGTTLYAKSTVDSYATDLTSNIFGNPHSASAASQLSTKRIDDVRLKVLRFFQADPNDFDVIFVANATAAIKLVADAFRDNEGGFWYGYHNDSHTSLVGVRELARAGSMCFENDTAVENWIANLPNYDSSQGQLKLFAYPGQSNMTGRRLPYEWCAHIREANLEPGCSAFSLLDAAALASTSQLDFSDVNAAPDFTAVSFYKIFGFPDLGALIVRKASSDVLRSRRYFGGGTVDMVSPCGVPHWHMKKDALHSAYEDGTLPFHTIIALDHALRVHTQLYGSMQNIANHTAALCSTLYNRMAQLKHTDGSSVCQIYSQEPSISSPCGPVVTFNIKDDTGKYVDISEVEKLAIVNNIQFRTGGLCNPGGIAKHLDLTEEEMKKNYAAGQRCGKENNIFHGKPIGVIRLSIGAMSSYSDIDRFVGFLEEFYVRHTEQKISNTTKSSVDEPRFYIESMSVYPIKSCAAFKIPASADWKVSAKGLAWDREWCLVHQGTNVALSQKRYPKMALIQPVIDISHRQMIVSFDDGKIQQQIKVSLDEVPTSVGSLQVCSKFKQSQSIVCGDSIPVQIYTSPDVGNFFSEALGVPCALARYFSIDTSARTAKLRKPVSKSTSLTETIPKLPSIKLANESPILLVSRSSVNRLNEQIRQRRTTSQEITPESFRANIIVSERVDAPDAESPYIEDTWRNLAIESGESMASFDMLGPCQRCQMVCVDQASAKRRQEPFSTLAKTRRWDGGVWFGVHLALSESQERIWSTLRVGDPVLPT